jgi:hypothetical protein
MSKRKTRTRGMGSIFQQPGCSTWTIQYYSLAGKRVRESTGTTNFKTAQKTLREKLCAIDKGDPIEPRRRQQVTCGELYLEELRDYRVNAKKSINSLAGRARPCSPAVPRRLRGS